MIAALAGGVAALAGGVGGARLSRGLARLLGDRLSVIVNTGDDFEHLGLPISPDLDTVTYTLAGCANPETGWGVANESWNFMAQLRELGGPDWFLLGDRDLATHVLRREWLGQGDSLTQVTARLCQRHGIASRILPMSDDIVRTRVQTAEGLLDFQDYFVRRRCDVAISGLQFDGAREARVPAMVTEAITAAEAIIVCPSNPYVSIDPILAVGDMQARLLAVEVPRVAVSPIIGGAAVKGPAAKMMRELGHAPSSLTVAEKYHGLLHGLVIDRADAALADAIAATGLAVRITDTLMRGPEDSERLAAEVIAFARSLRVGG
ncbi:2-phospho-L-lactate transferase [Ferrovibrio sp.]|uniref:2-phospho-L-lactate transferase n=1 Tax=Ferrovibrio sp. TaxID=1917215 RepID=UPI003D2C1E99